MFAYHPLALPAARIYRFFALGMLALLTLGAFAQAAARLPITPAAPAAARPASLALSIVPNAGQWDAAIRLQAPLAGGQLAFEDRAVLLAPASDRPLRVEFVGASPAAVAGADRQPGQFSFYQGSQAHAGLPTYAAVTYDQLYPGITLRYDGDSQHIKGTYTLAPGADPAQIRWRYAGADRVALDPASGSLQIALGSATLAEHAPVAWQEVGGQRVPVAVRYQLAGGAAAPEISFALGQYDAMQPLVIDPALVFGSYLGGRGADYGRGIAVDGAGNVYVVGDTFSANFLGYDAPLSGSKDVIVLKFNPAMSELLYGTIIGSQSADEAMSIAVNAAGEAYVLADPDGTDFPIQNARISTPPAEGDAVLIKLSAAGDILFSSYLGFGASGYYNHNAVALDSDSNVYVTGETYDAYNRIREVALVKLSPNGQTALIDFSKSGKRPASHGAAVAVGPDRRIYLTGVTDSYLPNDFATTPNALQPICPREQALGSNKDCDNDGFVIILSPTGAVEYSSYLGGQADDHPTSIAVDAKGGIYITGTTSSPDFPIKNAFQPTCPVDALTNSCYYHSFVTKLAPGATALAYSTYLGSNESDGQEFASAIAVDAVGSAYVAGFTNSQHFPIKDAPQPNLAIGLCYGLSERFCFDAFVTRLAPDGTLSYSTYLGGKDDEYTRGITLDRQGNAYVIGYTDSLAFPTTGGVIQPAKAGNTDFFVAKLGAGGPVPIPGLTHKLYLPLLGGR
jgi:hypothetical protein